MTISLDQLSPEVLALLNQQVGNAQARSVVPKPLSDLREPASPKERLFRPQFHWSADPDEAGKRPYKYRSYPKLMWNEAGEEKLVQSQSEEQVLVGEWRTTPPAMSVSNPIHDIESELALLTPEERQMVFEAHRQQRLSRIQAKLGQLTDEQMAQVAGLTEPDAAPVKRSPGRPRKHTDGDGA